MQEDYTHIIVVLDASGSMSPLIEDVKGSFKTFVDSQRDKGGKIVVDVFQFESSVDWIVRSAGLDELQTHMRKYSAGGCTALYDGICTAVDKVGAQFAAMDEKDRPADVVLVIVTDGCENASKEHNANDVKTRLELQQKVYNWDVVYLASGVDVEATARDIGFADADMDRAVAFERSETRAALADCLCGRANMARARQGARRKNN